MKRDSFCSFCGMEFARELQEQENFPRTCSHCGNIAYSVPNVVAVAVVPLVHEGQRTGILIVRRRDKIGSMMLALPGGFIDGPSKRGNIPESWQAAALRELREETGLTLKIDQTEDLCVIGPTSETNTILHFLKTLPVDQTSLNWEFTSEEIVGLTVAHEPVKLAFPTHTEVLRWVLEGQPGSIWRYSPRIAGYRRQGT